MALDLFSPLKVVSWASAHADCPMRYEITSPTELVITFGSDANEFEFSLDQGALRDLVQLGTEALAQLDADAGRINPTSTVDERTLAETMTALASKVRARAERRATASGTTPTIEGEATLQQPPRSRPSEHC